MFFVLLSSIYTANKDTRVVFYSIWGRERKLAVSLAGASAAFYLTMFVLVIILGGCIP